MCLYPLRAGRRRGRNIFEFSFIVKTRASTLKYDYTLSFSGTDSESRGHLVINYFG